MFIPCEGSCLKAVLLFPKCSPLVFASPPFLISNCLNLDIGTQGSSWWLNEACFIKTRNEGHRKAFVPRSPTGPCLVSPAVLHPVSFIRLLSLALCNV